MNSIKTLLTCACQGFLKSLHTTNTGDAVNMRGIPVGFSTPHKTIKASLASIPRTEYCNKLQQRLQQNQLSQDKQANLHFRNRLALIKIESFIRIIFQFA